MRVVPLINFGINRIDRVFQLPGPKTLCTLLPTQPPTPPPSPPPPHALYNNNAWSVRPSTDCGIAQLSNATGLSVIFYENPARVQEDCLTTPTGAVRVNLQYEQRKPGMDMWYAEYQQHGADFVQAGLVRGDEWTLQRGLFVLNWGVRHVQEHASDLNRAGGDAPHSVSFLFEAAARAALLLHSSDQCSAYVHADLMPTLKALAQWASDPQGMSMKGQHNATHVKFARAAAFGQLSNVLEDHHDDIFELACNAADRYVYEAVISQLPDGSFLEIKQNNQTGFDVSAHAASVLYATRAFASIRSLQSRTVLENAIRRGAQRMAPLVQQDGSIFDGNSKGGLGKRQMGTIDYKTIIMAQLHCAFLLRDQSLYDGAMRVAQFKYGQDSTLKNLIKTPFQRPVEPFKHCF